VAQLFNSFCLRFGIAFSFHSSVPFLSGRTTCVSFPEEDSFPRLVIHYFRLPLFFLIWICSADDRLFASAIGSDLSNSFSHLSFKGEFPFLQESCRIPFNECLRNFFFSTGRPRFFSPCSGRADRSSLRDHTEIGPGADSPAQFS